MNQLLKQKRALDVAIVSKRQQMDVKGRQLCASKRFKNGWSQALLVNMDTHPHMYPWSAMPKQNTAGQWLVTPVGTPVTASYPLLFSTPGTPYPAYQLHSPPAPDDLPPLIPDDEEYRWPAPPQQPAPPFSYTLTTPIIPPGPSVPPPTPHPLAWPLPPPPITPYGYVATPLHTPIYPPRRSHRRRRRRQQQQQQQQQQCTPNPSPIDLPFYSARIRSLDETVVPLVSIPWSRSKGRPSHWRAGYRPTTSTMMKNCLTKPMCVSNRHNLNDLLQYQPPRTFALLLDLRSSYTTTLLHNPERYSTLVEMYQLATSPPTHEMKLYHPNLPYDVNIHASSSSGITVHDVLYQLCESLQEPIYQSDYYNDILSAEDRERLLFAYQLRGQPAGGLRKIDFLGSEVVFRGLRRTREGWYIKTTT
ncbi:hypothetical protein D9757_002599 [Collybiopsis confluens]|uniref:DUF6699 domain-containing protein n=1 Tax=Collybiopsis confluens TaxID=2823264 RepID=A0A8H5HW58_9AGAR|nr:hypothetical protein D9757_002599 [Collybiopsis confluens]